MKKLCVLCIMFFITSFAWAEPFGIKDSSHGPFGAGIIIGIPTGLTVKLMTMPTQAIDAALSWDFITQSFSIHADYLFIFNDVIVIEKKYAIPLYAGIGAYTWIAQGGANLSNVGVGVRVPLGITYYFSEPPLELFFEIVPGVEVFPTMKAAFGGGIGLRYYF